jgi:tetratricopeptide (TPR) repeat protein
VTNNLGILLEEKGNLHKAERYYSKALRIFERTGIRRSRAYSLGNLANLYRHAARYDRARAAYEEVEDELRAMGEVHAAAYTAGNLGDLSREFGDLETAHRRYEETLDFAVKSGDEELKSECYCRLAHLCMSNKRMDVMEKNLRHAESAARRANSGEFSLCARLLRIEWALENNDLASAHRGLESAVREAARLGLLYYQIWSKYLHALLLHKETNEESAKRIIQRAAASARKSGYTRWELRLMASSLSFEHSKDFSQKCLRRCEELVDQIHAGIGDSRVRELFNNLPEVASIIAHAIASPQRSMTYSVDTMTQIPSV